MIDSIRDHHNTNKCSFSFMIYCYTHKFTTFSAHRDNHGRGCSDHSSNPWKRYLWKRSTPVSSPPSVTSDISPPVSLFCRSSDSPGRSWTDYSRRYRIRPLSSWGRCPCALWSYWWWWSAWRRGKQRDFWPLVFVCPWSSRRYWRSRSRYYRRSSLISPLAHLRQHVEGCQCPPLFLQPSHPDQLHSVQILHFYQYWMIILCNSHRSHPSPYDARWYTRKYWFTCFCCW